MRAIKPNCLSLLARPVEHRGQINFCVSAMAMLPLRGGPFLFSDQKLWQVLPEAAPGFMETGVMKARSEFLLYGFAYRPPDAPPQGEASLSGTFGARLGTMRKVGRAFGRRVMQGQDLVRREPLVRAPLDGTGAYGGPAWLANPIGRGHPSARRDDGLLDLPQVESTDRPWHPDPARNEALTLGALDITHPFRMQQAGTYDAQWLETDFPGLARDGKWTIHNVAAPDQQCEALAGDEEYHLANLHPEEAQLRGRLPGLVATALVQHADDRLERVPTQLRTVVFLPEADRVVLIWQGHCRCTKDDGTDIQTVLIGLERTGHRRETAHYAAVLAARTDAEDALLESLRDDQLLPEGVPFEGIIPADFDLNKPPGTDSLEARQRRRAEAQMQEARAEVQKHGLDPDLHAPPARMPSAPKLPPVHELGEYFRKLQKAADQQTKKLLDQHKAHIDEVDRELSAGGTDFEVIRREMAGAQPGAGPGLPKPVAAPAMELLRREAEVARATGAPSEKLEAMLTDGSLEQPMLDADRGLLELYQRSAHHQPSAAPADADTREMQRRSVARRLARGDGLRDLDLTGADLRGLSLEGVDCTGVFLESANLAGVSLVGACLNGAVLAHADLRGAQAARCDFSKANLGKADCEGLVASDADFSGAVLVGTRFSKARLADARFTDAQLQGTRFDGADLAGAELGELAFLDLDFTDATLDRARLGGASFVGARLGGARLAGAEGAGVSFVNVACADGDFRGARLPGSRWVGAIDLGGARFDGADLTRAYFAQGTRLSGASLERVTADGASFAGCLLDQTRWRGARLRAANFRGALLNGADLYGVDLMEALLSGSILYGTDLRRSSLYAADLARVQTDQRTRLQEVFAVRARSHPRWKPPADGT